MDYRPAVVAHPEIPLDNLIANGKATPTIVVMPNGRDQKKDRPEGNVFAVLERDLLDGVIPSIESRYSVRAGRECRALAGLSMGGELIFGFLSYIVIALTSGDWRKMNPVLWVIGALSLLQLLITAGITG